MMRIIFLIFGVLFLYSSYGIELEKDEWYGQSEIPIEYRYHSFVDLNLVHLDKIEMNSQFDVANSSFSDFDYVIVLQELIEENFKNIDQLYKRFLWFYFLSKNDFMVKMTYDVAGMAWVYLGSNDKLYGINYFEEDGIFFNLNECLGDSPLENGKMWLVNLSSLCGGKRISWNLDMLSEAPIGNKMMKNLPRFDIKKYLTIKLNMKNQELLAKNLIMPIRNLSLDTQMTFIEDWIRSKFEYESDIELYGKSKIFTANETLSSHYNDCEDRAILFYHIINTFYEDLDVILIEYSDHVNVGVSGINNAIQRPAICYKNNLYSIFEPTIVQQNDDLTVMDRIQIYTQTDFNVWKE